MLIDILEDYFRAGENPFRIEGYRRAMALRAFC